MGIPSMATLAVENESTNKDNIVKRTLLLMTSLLIFTAAVHSQDAASSGGNGPVWRISEYRFDPGKRQEYIKYLKEHRVPIIAEQKRQGLILDYKFFHNDTTAGLNEVQHVEAVLYRNYADALDIVPERGKKFREVALKHYGSEEAMRKSGDTFATLRVFVRGYLLHEMTIDPSVPAGATNK
jgi:hypothetical protein